jgi:hypothetical protein
VVCSFFFLRKLIVDAERLCRGVLDICMNRKLIMMLVDSLNEIWMVAKQEYCLPYIYIFVASTYMENLLNPSLLVIFSRNHDIYGLISSHVISNINTSFYFDLSLQKRLKKITNLSIGIYSYKLKQCFCVMLINVRNFHVFF